MVGIPHHFYYYILFKCFILTKLFIEKYTYTKMGRIVVNKHFDDIAKITSESFVNKGEIIVSNQVGNEGILIKNNNGEIFLIGPTNGAGSEESSKHFLISASQYEDLVKNGKVIIDGEEIFYDNNTYYAVYEDVE